MFFIFLGDGLTDENIVTTDVRPGGFIRLLAGCLDQKLGFLVLLRVI
jgi:hypothetical protein